MRQFDLMLRGGFLPCSEHSTDASSDKYQSTRGVDRTIWLDCRVMTKSNECGLGPPRVVEDRRIPRDQEV